MKHLFQTVFLYTTIALQDPPAFHLIYGHKICQLYWYSVGKIISGFSVASWDTESIESVAKYPWSDHSLAANLWAKSAKQFLCYERSLHGKMSRNGNHTMHEHRPSSPTFLPGGNMCFFEKSQFEHLPSKYVLHMRVRANPELMVPWQASEGQNWIFNFWQIGEPKLASSIFGG